MKTEQKSVTRRGATRKATKVLSVLLAAGVCFAAAEAWAEKLLLVRAQVEGRGVTDHGTFSRITDAVVRARELRRGDSQERIVIDVGPGTYPGSFDPAALAANPSWEPLPIILDVSNLTLRGKTRIDTGNDGLPTAPKPGADTTILADSIGSPDDFEHNLGMAMILIPRTVDRGLVMAGEDVTVTGLHLSARNVVGFPGGTGIWVERVKGFRLEGNVIDAHGCGIQTKAASGLINGNLISEHYIGILLEGGTSHARPDVEVDGNRIANGGHGLMVFGEPAVGEPLTLPADAPTLDREPSGSPSAGIRLTVTGNDISDNFLLGVEAIPEPLTFADPSQVKSDLELAFEGNSVDRNALYGFMIRPFLSDAVPGTPHQTFIQAAIRNNEIEGNGSGQAWVGFARCGPDECPDAVYEHASSMVITSHRSITFDYLNPEFDPNHDPATPLGNSLEVDGVSYTGEGTTGPAKH